MSNSLWPQECNPPGSSVHEDSPGKNTRVSSHALLQGIFPTQRLNSGLQHYMWIPYHLSYQGSPRLLEWVAYPFSRESSWPRNWTRISCIAGGFFTNWATREAPSSPYVSSIIFLNVCAQTSPMSKNASHIGLGPTFMTSFKLELPL